MSYERMLESIKEDIGKDDESKTQREYLGTIGDNKYFYLVKKLNDAGEIEDVVVTDQDDTEVFSAAARSLDFDDMALIVQTVINEVEISNISYEVVTKYLLTEPEEDEEETGDEENLAAGADKIVDGSVSPSGEETVDIKPGEESEPAENEEGEEIVGDPEQEQEVDTEDDGESQIDKLKKAQAELS